MYYSDNELHQRYRFSRHTIRYITRLVEDEISPAINRSQPWSFCDKTSAHQTKIFGIRKLSASNRGHGCWLRQVHCLKNYPASNGRSFSKACQLVNFPDTQEERVSIKQGIYEIAILITLDFYACSTCLVVLLLIQQRRGVGVPEVGRNRAYYY